MGGLSGDPARALRGGLVRHRAHLELNYGLAPDLQLHFIAPFAYQRAAGQGAASGYGDTEVGFKYRFMGETDRRPMLGIFPLVELPTGSRGRGLGNGRAQVFLPVWLQKSLGAWTT